MPKLYTFIKDTGNYLNPTSKPLQYVSVVAKSEKEARDLLGRMSIVFVSCLPLARA